LLEEVASTAWLPLVLLLLELGRRRWFLEKMTTTLWTNNKGRGGTLRRRKHGEWQEARGVTPAEELWEDGVTALVDEQQA
jgi:hypothetical protein